MARPSQDAIDTFVGITGASEAVALQKLEEHGGDLNQAIDGYFNEGDRTNASALAPHSDFMNIDDPIDVDPPIPSIPLLSAAQNLNPFGLLNSSLGRNFFDEGATGFSNPAPQVSHPREVREIPIEFKDRNTHPGSSGHGLTIEDVSGSEPAHAPEVQGNVIIDDEDEDLPTAPANHGANDFADVSYERLSRPSVTPLGNMTEYNNDIEEEMIQAAIEASRREVEASTSQHFEAPDGTIGPKLDNKPPPFEDVELAHAVSLSLKTAEQERALRELGVQVGEQPSNSSGIKLEEVRRETAENGRQGSVTSRIGTSGKSIIDEGSQSVLEEDEDVEEQPLVRHRSRQSSFGIEESGQLVNSPPSGPQHEQGSHQPNGESFQSDEWGGISSVEHDEAVMLEAAMFGGVPEGSAYNFTYPPHEVLQSGSSRNFPRIPRPPSPTLTAQRLLREQQDDEYLAALQADREKELKAAQEAEHRRLEAAAAREAAREIEKQQEEEARRKLIEEEEFERKLAAKQACLPQEPSADDESAVTLLIRMPDGSRCGRRFLKADKFQFLFDYIDIGRVVKPGTYRLVRPYPRQAFTDGESALSFSELGLTGKQEALFLELI